MCGHLELLLRDVCKFQDVYDFSGLLDTSSSSRTSTTSKDFLRCLRVTSQHVLSNTCSSKRLIAKWHPCFIWSNCKKEYLMS